MILSYLFGAFLVYLLYRFVFGFVLPVVRTTRRVKRSFRDMQEKMNAQHGAQTNRPAYSQQQAATAQKTAANGDEDYIEFEEVK